MRLLFLVLLLVTDCGSSDGTIVVVSGDLLAGSGDLSVSSGDLSASSGDLSASSGDLSASGGDLSTVSGDLSAQLESVTFSYTPQWAGVTAVAVIGGFNTGTDWQPANPFLTLTKNGSIFSGTVMLPRGSYPFLYIVTGDDAATAGFKRYSIDPLNSDFIKCPAGAPTAGNDPNPCSVMTAPQKPAAATFHLKGQVVYNGVAKAAYLAVLERDEQMSHHFFANRMNTDAHGKFDLIVSKGAYRIQVLHPTYLDTTDSMRIPASYNALRRTISSAVTVSSAVTLEPPAEVAFNDYSAMAPQPVDGGEALPTTFTITLNASPGYATARAQVYGGHAGFETVGDPWWTSQNGTQTQASFDGTFNTAKASTPSVVPGTRYFWGEEESTDKVDGGSGGVVWTGESMVFPITWH